MRTPQGRVRERHIVKTRPLSLPGCVEIEIDSFEDQRGWFVKVFRHDLFEQLGLRTDFREQYCSLSRRGVLRGLHFQVPPMEHAKLVYCIEGRVFDAVVDLRRESPTYGRHATLELSREAGNLVYIPSGFAHGFYVLSERALLIYNVTSVYSSQHDRGILWNSAGIAWPDNSPIVSQRDAAHPTLNEFESPFTYLLTCNAAG